MSEMTVQEKMANAKAEKERLIRMILTYQSGHQYTFENIGTKTLRQLQKIYDKVMHHC